MRGSLPACLIALVAASLVGFAAGTPVQPLRPRGSSCNSVPAGQADRRGAAAVAQQLIDDANTADDRQSGGMLEATPDFTTVARYGWLDAAGDSHETLVQIRVLPSASRDLYEVARRNVYGTVMDLIYGCSDRSCADDSCTVSGDAVPNSDPGVQVRLTGNSL